MREIKFRSWNVKTKKMGMLTGIVQGELFAKYQIPMQYTGLKDKNGSEIYEDDITVNDEVTSSARIVYDQKECRFVQRYADGVSIPIKSSNVGFNSIQVIGNIYENLELLDQK